MIIVPKLGESNVTLNKDLLSVIGSKVEIQMKNKDLNESLENCKRVLTNLIYEGLDIDEVVLHMPFSMHVFEVYVASSNHLSDLLDFIKGVEILASHHNIKIGILLHQESSTELLESIDPQYTIINSILNSIINDNVYFLIENCLPCLNAFDVQKIPAFDLLDKVNHNKLFACIDLCHIRCYENIFKTNLEIPKSISKRVRWIHFSYTAKQDGYMDKSTHGVKHPTLQSAFMDLQYLVWNNIDLSLIPIVAEITEKDYNLYPDMIEEINLLNVLNKNSNIVNERLKLFTGKKVMQKII